MKKRANASNRAVAELLSNSTDNKKEARRESAAEIDRRAELKKEFFGSAESFEALSEETVHFDAPKANASAENEIKKRDNADRLNSHVAAVGMAEFGTIGKSAPVSAPVRNVSAERPVSSRPNKPVADCQRTAPGREAPRSRNAANAAAVKPTAERAEAVVVKAKQKKTKSIGKIVATVASAVLLLAVLTVGAGIYLYMNREPEFIPADVTAGILSADTTEYVQLAADTKTVYPTDGRYNVKFTFYQSPEIVCTTTETTVGALMEKLDITVGEDNRCSMTPDAVVSSDSTVDIQTITYQTVSKDEAIPFETEYVDVRTIPKGSTKVNVNGENGVKTYTYKCTLVNGVEESRELVSETVTKKPKTRVMYRGVGGTIKCQGRYYNYSYYIDVKATVYNIVGTTASGLPTSISVMAVDPRVIPLGTKCVVTGISGDYGYRVAADTGGDIKGNKIDLWYPAGTFNGFGWKSTRVYILE